MENSAVEEKLKKGWVKCVMWFEILAIDENVTKESLKEHIAKLKKGEGVEVISEKFEDVEKVDNPFPQIEKAYSQSVQLQIMFKDIETLLYNVVFFAPSAVEVIEPKSAVVGANTLQVIMNSVADLVHRYAAQGAGGVVISTKK